MAILDNAIWLTGTGATAANGTTVITDGAESTTVTGTFTAGIWDASQTGYAISEFGAFGVTTPASMNYDFSDPVEDISFDFNHISDDGGSTYDDKWTIYIYDSNGVLIPAADVIAAFSGMVDENVYANPDGSVSIEAEGTASSDVNFTLSGYQISSMELVLEPGSGGTQTGGTGISDISFTIPVPDGTVEGTSGNDTIDAAYAGDPEGDLVDANDAILAGDTGDDDLIYGFGGDDTITAGDGDDEIYGGDDNDEVFASTGDDTLSGDAGNDSLFGGDGADSISGGSGDDTIYGDAETGGWQYEYYDLDPTGDPRTLTQAGFIGGGTTFNGTPTEVGYSNSIAPTTYDTGNDYALKFTSELNITTAGEYTFATASDDGSKLFIDGVEVVNNDGHHGVITETGTVTLTPGVHVIEIIYYENDGGNVLSATIAGPDTGGSTTSLTNYDGLNEASGDDTIDGGDGNDTIFGGLGDDTIILGDGFGIDTIDGSEDGGDPDIDVLDASSMTTDATLDLSGADPEAGTLIEGANVATFDNIEEFVLGSGDDSATGSDGNDTIDLGQGADTIEAGLGDDIIDLGTGPSGNPDQDADVIILNDDFGSDVVSNFDAPTPNGDGTFTGIDTLDVTGLFDRPSGDPDREPVNVNDVVVSDDGAGNAVLTFPNGESITLNGISPTDADDPFYLNAIGIPLSDGTVSGTSGNDVIDGSYLGDTDGDLVDNGDAVIPSYASNDDLIEAGAGNDTITGGLGSDTVFGGSGDDTTIFSDGDSIDGGTGDDTFSYENLGEAANGTITIVGGSGGETPDDGDPNTLEGDTLQLGTGADLSTLIKVSDGINANGNETFSGSVQMDDGTLLNFSEIENIICFTPGTQIATPFGARDITSLKVGDLVVTRDHGLQPIRWIQSRTVPAVGRFAPIRIRPGAVTGLDRDLLVSPQHRMLFQGYRAELLFGEREVLVSATHMVDGKYVTQNEGGTVTYIHMMFDEHEIVFADGAASESFHPGLVGLDGVTEAAREELFGVFPELRTNANGYGTTARRCLKRHEAELVRT
jgi:Ca2+-binding RTX toxin-like protein